MEGSLPEAVRVPYTDHSLLQSALCRGKRSACDEETFQLCANLPRSWNRVVPAKHPPWLCPRVGSSKMQHSAHGRFSLCLFWEVATPKSQPVEGRSS